MYRFHFFATNNVVSSHHQSLLFFKILARYGFKNDLTACFGVITFKRDAWLHSPCFCSTCSSHLSLSHWCQTFVPWRNFRLYWRYFYLLDNNIYLYDIKK